MLAADSLLSFPGVTLSRDTLTVMNLRENGKCRGKPATDGIYFSYINFPFSKKTSRLVAKASGVHFLTDALFSL